MPRGKRYHLGRYQTLMDTKASLAIARATSHEGSPSRACAPRGSEARSGKVARARVTVEQIAEDWLADFEKQAESGQRKLVIPLRLPAS